MGQQSRVVLAHAAVRVGLDVHHAGGELARHLVGVGEARKAEVEPPVLVVGAGVLDLDEVVRAVRLPLEVRDTASEGVDLAGDRGGGLVEPPLPALAVTAGGAFLGYRLEPVWILFSLPVAVGLFFMLDRRRGGVGWEVVLVL